MDLSKPVLGEILEETEHYELLIAKGTLMPDLIDKDVYVLRNKHTGVVEWESYQWPATVRTLHGITDAYNDVLKDPTGEKERAVEDALKRVAHSDAFEALAEKGIDPFN